MQAQIFLLFVLITAIINYFIGTFIPFESKKSFGFFGYDSMATSVSPRHGPESHLAFSDFTFFIPLRFAHVGKHGSGLP